MPQAPRASSIPARCQSSPISPRCGKGHTPRLLRLRGTKSSFSAAEIFIFLALLYVGLDAACLAAAAEAFVASARTSKRWTSRLVSPAVAALSIGVTGWIFLEVANALQSRELYGEGTLLGLLPANRRRRPSLSRRSPALCRAPRRSPRA